MKYAHLCNSTNLERFSEAYIAAEKSCTEEAIRIQKIREKRLQELEEVAQKIAMSFITDREASDFDDILTYDGLIDRLKKRYQSTSVDFRISEGLQRRIQSISDGRCYPDYLDDDDE